MTIQQQLGLNDERFYAMRQYNQVRRMVTTIQVLAGLGADEALAENSRRLSDYLSWFSGLGVIIDIQVEASPETEYDDGPDTFEFLSVVRTAAGAINITTESGMVALPREELS